MITSASMGVMKKRKEPPRITIEIEDVKIRDAFVSKVRGTGKSVKYVIMQWIKAYLRS